MPFPAPNPHPTEGDSNDGEDSSPAQESAGECVLS